MKKKPAKEKPPSITFNISHELLTKLDGEVQTKGLSRSDILRIIIGEHYGKS